MSHTRPRKSGEEGPTAPDQQLRAAGLRATPARVAVLDAVRRANQPLTHDDVAQLLAGQPWDKATVFRNLVTLSDAGLVVRTDHGDRRWRYESPPGKARRHAHFLCSDCGVVSCLWGVHVQIGGDAPLPRSARDGRFEVQLRGRCDRCTGA